MKEQDVKWIVLGLLTIFLLNCVGCGEKTDTTVVTQFCTVVKNDADAVITCPDGSTVTLPPQIINEMIETIIEVPVIIYVPRCEANNNSKKCKKH